MRMATGRLGGLLVEITNKKDIEKEAPHSHGPKKRKTVLSSLLIYTL
jgi:hypothetical protein